MSESYEVAELAGRQPKWKLTLSEDSLRLEPLEAGEAFDVPRAERVARVDLLNGTLTRRLLGITLGKGKKIFRMDEAGFAAYQAWAGPPTLDDLRKALKRRFGWSLTLGILIILTSLPIPGDPEAGVPDLPLNGLSMAMGAALILAGLMSRWMPSRWFFLSDSLWIAIAMTTTVRYLLESFGAFNAVVLLLQLNYVVTSLKEFAYFGALKDGTDPAPAARAQKLGSP